MLEAESLREPVGESLDAEPLRRVVAAGDEVDAELPRLVERRLLRLARQ